MPPPRDGHSRETEGTCVACSNTCGEHMHSTNLRTPLHSPTITRYMYRAATNSSYSQLGSDLSRNVTGEQTRLGSSGSSGPCWASSLRAGGCGSGRPACAAAGPRSRRGQAPGVPPWLQAAGSGPGSAPPWRCATGATGPGPS